MANMLHFVLEFKPSLRFRKMQSSWGINRVTMVSFVLAIHLHTCVLFDQMKLGLCSGKILA